MLTYQMDTSHSLAILSLSSYSRYIYKTQSEVSDLIHSHPSGIIRSGCICMVTGGDCTQVQCVGDIGGHDGSGGDQLQSSVPCLPHHNEL